MTVRQKDLARILGVSQMTVSRVRNNLPGVGDALRAKILTAMHRHDYVRDRAAARLRGAPARVVGVIVPDIASSFFPDLISGIRNAADTAGYMVLLADSRESCADEARQVEKLREFNVDGLIIAPAGAPRRAAIYQRLLARSLPFVFIDRYKPAVRCSYVVSDTRGGARMLGAYLAGKGYKRWGYLAGPAGVSSAMEHHDGLRAAFRAAGLPPGNLRCVTAGFDEHGGYEAAGRLLAGDRFDVIVAVNDAVAFGAYRLMREQGIRVPDDVALAGFSNLRGGDLLSAPLTTVRECTDEMGPKAFELLLRHMRDPLAAPEKARLGTALVIRDSA